MKGALGCLWFVGIAYLFYVALDTGNAVGMLALLLVVLGSLDVEDEQG